MATASHKVLPPYCSAFFCPEGALAALKAWVMEALPGRALTEQPVRIRVPGWSTGECAYGIAVLLLARAGMYPESDMQDVAAAPRESF